VPDSDIPTERSSLLPHANTSTIRPETWRQVALTVLALLEVAGWTVAVVYKATRVHSGIFGLVTAVIALASWVYAALRPSIRPSRTPYYDLFTIYSSHFLAACVALYELSTSSTGDIGLSYSRLGQVSNSLLTLVGLVIIVNMPLNITTKPEADENVRFTLVWPVFMQLKFIFKGILPPLEDHCTLWQWITFTWVSPLISLGALRPLEEKDMWQLSRAMRTRVLMRKFLQVQ
jgi:hypothetical protein